MKIIKLLTTTLLLGATFLGITSVDVSAGITSDTQIPSVILNQIIEDDDDEENTYVIEPPQSVSKPLTPDGNLTLVDDIVTEEGDNYSKQFITVVSKSGNYFYLVIDRDNEKGTENVYFLNLVDERDLLALIPEEPVEEVVEEIVIIEPEPEPVPEPEPIEEEKGSMFPLLLLLGLGGGGAYYYLNFIKPKDDDNGVDFDDDEDEEESATLDETEEIE